MKSWLVLLKLMTCVAVVNAATRDYLSQSDAFPETAATIPDPIMVIESLDGPVTQAEIDSYKDYLQYYVTPSSSNDGNNLVYGTSGKAMEGLGMLYSFTGDLELLDRMIEFADAALSGRNDPVTGVITWTGSRDPVWSVPDPGAAEGDIVGHIAFCAKLILDTPSIYGQTVGVGDPYGYGTTYYDRALTYVQAGDLTATTYLVPHLVRTDRQNRYYFPNHERFGSSAGLAVPWNQQAMISNGFQRLAECHEILGDNPQLVAEFDSYVQAHIDWFIESTHKYQANGVDVYSWAYRQDRNPVTQAEDSAHSQYTVLAVSRAYFSWRYDIPYLTVRPITDTFKEVMTLGHKAFSDRVNLVSNEGYNVMNWMYPYWLMIGSLDDAVYRAISIANMEAGGRQKTGIDHTAMILWAKNARWKAENEKSAHLKMIPTGLDPFSGEALLEWRVQPPGTPFAVQYSFDLQLWDDATPVGEPVLVESGEQETWRGNVSFPVDSETSVFFRGAF